MNNVKRILCIAVMCISLFARAQDDKGIQWSKDPSWQAVKDRAKAENKYIFVDVFATWCGPCKRMEKEVYTNDSVGDFFNKNFIAVKLQTDQTANDDVYVKSWYNDAESILNDYAIDAFPSFIFFSPEGAVVDMNQGFKNKDELLYLAKATTSIKETNPYKEYWQLVQDYKQGIKNYEKMPSMIPVAFKFRQEKFAMELMENHWNYISKIKPEERFKKENILLWGNYFILRSEGPRFQFFFKNAKKIDEVAGKGYAARVIDKTIEAEIIDSFFRMQKGETTIITGERVPNKEVMFMWLPIRRDGKIEPDYQEANWKQLKRMLAKKYNKETVERNLLRAKLRWYEQHQNKGAYVQCKYEQLRKFTPDFEHINIWAVNNDGYVAYKYSTDKKLLNAFIQWLDELGIQKKDNPSIFDTYAKLLYKAGRTQEAIKNAEKALSLAIMTKEKYHQEASEYKTVLEQMKRGEPTSLEEGAIWPKKNP